MQRLIARRTAKVRSASRDSVSERTTTIKDLANEYERHTQRQRTLINRAAVVTERLAVLVAALKRLLDDERFLALLRTEALDTMPAPLAERLRPMGVS